jgi:microcystin-dependent protein
MDPLLGDIVCFSFNFNPMYWLSCEGQTLSIASNQSLFTLLGTTFGGNGTTNFCLPNLNGSARFGGYMKYYIAVQGIYPSRS